MRRFTIEDACRELRGKDWTLAGSIGGRASVQAVSNALRHGRRHRLIESKVVGPGNRSMWRLCADEQKGNGGASDEAK